MYKFYGAETGDVKEGTTLSATPPVVSTAWTNGGGGYSFLLGDTTKFIEFNTGIAASTMYFRFVINVDCGPTTGGQNGSVFAAYIYDSAAGNCGGVGMISTFSTGTFILRGTPQGGTQGTDTAAINSLTPTVVQGFYTKGTGANAIMSITVNGVTLTVSNGTGTVNPLYLRFTGTTTAGSNAVKIYIDDVAVSDTALPPKLGQCIARQIKAGTPTYNTWTKTGGATVDLCWSDTPTNATKFCVASAASQAQTGLVSSFSATQTGHGTAVMGSSDTANAVKVCAVGKRGSGAGTTHVLRYRYNAADSNSADWTAITTTDTYFEFYPAVTLTVGNLNASEAGGVQGTGSAQLFTVEDVWVMVDYTPANMQPMAMII